MPVEVNPVKPKCAIALWIYPLGSNCINALIDIGKNSSEDYKKLRHLRNKSFKLTDNKIPQECKVCLVMATSSDGQNT